MKTAATMLFAAIHPELQHYGTLNHKCCLAGDDQLLPDVLRVAVDIAELRHRIRTS